MIGRLVRFDQLRGKRHRQSHDHVLRVGLGSGHELELAGLPGFHRCLRHATGALGDKFFTGGGKRRNFGVRMQRRADDQRCQFVRWQKRDVPIVVGIEIQELSRKSPVSSCQQLSGISQNGRILISGPT